MSVPGYAYPAFDYTEAEFLSASAPTVIATAGDVANGFLRSFIVVAGDGKAAFLREATCSVATSAAVGNRTVSLQLNNPDSGFAARYNSPAAFPANTNITTQWSVGIATAYTAGVGAFSPAPSIVVPPGYAWIFLVLSPQLNDSISLQTAFGLTIPTAATAPPTPAPIARPLLT